MRKRSLGYRHTIAASYLGYVTQAIVNNFAPLLFLTFQKSYHIGMRQITMLVTVNFCVQLTVDWLSAKLLDRIGYRVAAVAAHVFAATGLIGLAVFPPLFGAPYAGLLTAVVVYAIGGGLTEVVISPIVEACPSEAKSAAMSLLHSFYCWGSVLVVAGSALFFWSVGLERWQVLSMVWALLPIGNAVYFCFVPIGTLVEDGESMNIGELFRTGLFRRFAVCMLCAGAAELSMSQWASAFAERVLGVSKSVGDLLGPCMFAVCMGSARVGSAWLSKRIRLKSLMLGSSVLCIAAYLLAVFSGVEWLGFAACGLCGFSVGIFWPGVFSLASKALPKGGTAMFALLALFGDVGCSGGPTLVGMVSAQYNDNLKVGLATAMLFPLIFLFAVMGVKEQQE